MFEAEKKSDMDSKIDARRSSRMRRGCTGKTMMMVDGEEEKRKRKVLCGTSHL